MDNEQYLKEVQEALERDDTLLGQVWRLTEKGKSPIEIADKLNVPTSGFVYSYRKYIRAIKEEEEDLPTRPTMAKQCGSALRGFVKRHREDFSDETIKVLKSRAEKCDRLVTNPEFVEQEDDRIEKETSEVEGRGSSGIYVYTYPHYYRFPVVPGKDGEPDRTYLKIGRTEGEVEKRVSQQTTGMPEPAMVLQIWTVENDSELKGTEEKIHDHLRTIGHSGRQDRRRGPQEWFLTNEDSVASTADLIGLKNKHDHRETDE